MIKFSTLYPGYGAMDDGSVWSILRGYPRRIATAINKWGYVTCNIRVGGKSKNVPAHRIVADAFIPNTERKPQVNHINLDKSDNRPSNLEWATRSENMRHAASNGRMGHLRGHNLKGENQGRSVMTEVLVIDARARYMNGEKVKDIASSMGVGPSTISNAVRLCTWGHVEPGAEYLTWLRSRTAQVAA